MREKEMVSDGNGFVVLFGRFHYDHRQRQCYTTYPSVQTHSKGVTLWWSSSDLPLHISHSFPFFKISCAARRLILKYLILVIMSLYIFFFLLCLLVVYINMLTQLNYTQIAVFATAKSIPASQLLLHIPNH